MNNLKTVNVELLLDKRRARENGDFPMKLRLIFNRNVYYISLGIYLSEPDYEKLKSGTKLSEEKRAIKLQLEEHKARANQVIQNMVEFNFERFKIEFSGAKIVESSNDQSINGLFQELMETPLRKPASIQADQTALHSLRRYFEFIKSKQGVKSHISVINLDFLKRWQAFLVNEGNHPKRLSTVGSYARHIRIVMNIALERGYITKEQFPFGTDKKRNKKKYVITTAQSRKHVLSKEQMKKLIDIDLDPKSLECFSRDWFALSYLCCGINAADLLELKNSDLTHDGFSFYRRKVFDTSESPNKLVHVQFIDDLRDITLSFFNRLRSTNTHPKAYLFPIYTKSMNERERFVAKRNLVRKINQHLPKLAKIAEIENIHLSYGVARHTFASILHDSDVSSITIGGLLGHSNINTTNAYIHTLPGNPQKKAMKNLY
jgi:site-specific recombinase XerD